jgi:dTMP kinase
LRSQIDLRRTSLEKINKRPFGKLIAVEGIDGSGKGTQVQLLHRALSSLTGGPGVYATAFPQYHSWFGNMVGQFLNGDFGALDRVDAHFTALLYAGDRFEAKPGLEAALSAGKIVLVDRYIGSNLAHQTARVSTEKRDEFRRWIEHLEYNIYGLRREDLVLYLRVPPAEAQKLVTQKAKRTYTSAKQDILEASLHHLQDAAGMYDLLAQNSPWVTIECFDVKRRTMRAPKDIAHDVLSAVEPFLHTSALPRGKAAVMRSGGSNQVRRPRPAPHISKRSGR